MYPFINLGTYNLQITFFNIFRHIEKAIKKLSKNHALHIIHYDPHFGADNTRWVRGVNNEVLVYSKPFVTICWLLLKEKCWAQLLVLVVDGSNSSLADLWNNRKANMAKKLELHELEHISIFGQVTTNKKYYTLRKKNCRIDLEFLHILRFCHFPSRQEVQGGSVFTAYLWGDLMVAITIIFARV